MEALATQWQGKAQFVFVYGMEHHPNTDDLPLPLPDSRPIPVLDQPANQAARIARTRAFLKEMGGSTRRFLVDEDTRTGSKAEELYGAGRSARVVVVDTRGQIAFYKSEVVVSELEKCLRSLTSTPAP
jgi:hypothetical protein